MLKDIIIVLSVTMFVTFFIWWLQQLTYNLFRCYIPWLIIIIIGFGTMFGMYYLLNNYKNKKDEQTLSINHAL